MMKYLIALVLTTAALSGSNFAQLVQQKDAFAKKTLNTIVALPPRDTSTPTLLQRAILVTRISGGIFSAEPCGGERPSGVAGTRKVRLGLLFSELERANPNYLLEYGKGFVNLLPFNHVSELLEMPIKDFEITDLTPDDALAKLMDQTDVKKKISALGLDEAVSSVNVPQYFDSTGLNGRDKLRATIHFTNTTFRQILNAIVQIRPGTSWIYSQGKCNNELRMSLFLIG